MHCYFSYVVSRGLGLKGKETKHHCSFLARRVMQLTPLSLPKDLPGNTAGPEGRAGTAGPPVFLSNAHFCDVDSAVANTVEGLNCSLSEHVTFLDVEPTTGITMRAAKRLMMSTEYGPGESHCLVDSGVAEPVAELSTCLC